MATTSRPVQTPSEQAAAETPVRQAAEDSASEAIPSLGHPRGQALLGVFTVAHFTHHLSNSLLPPLLPYIRDAFALSYGQSGFLVTAFSASLGFSNAPIGVLADRVGPRPVIVVGLLLTGLISAAIAFAGDYLTLFGLLMAMGLVAGSYHAPSSALLAQAFAARVRGAAMGTHITGGHLSFFALPLAAAGLVELTGTWRTPFLWLAFGPVVAGVLVWLLAPRRHERSPTSTDRWAVFREIGSVVQTVGPLVSFSVVFQMIYSALLAFLTLYLVDARQVPGWLAAVYFGVPQLVGMFAAPTAGFLSDRLGRRTVILIGMGIIGPAYFSVTLVPSELVLLPLVVVGFAASMRQVVTEVLVTETAPTHRRATVLGGYYMLSQELGGLAAPALGIIASLLGMAAAFGYVTLALAIGSALVVLVHRRL